MDKIDLLITNANVLTLDCENSRAGSVAVKDGKIVNIWQEPEPPIGSINVTNQTELVNLHGATLLPGFIDTHNHILMYSSMQNQVDCSSPKNKTINDIKESIRLKVKEMQVNEWVVGHSYDDTLLYERRHLTRYDLDEVAPNNPVLIRHTSGHLAAANSLGLEYAGLDNSVSDPQGGHYGRDDKGQLNGVLYEPSAMQVVLDQIPKQSNEERIQQLGKTSQEYLAHGITTNTDAAVGMFDGLQELDIHLKAAERNVNPMRTQLMIMHHFLREGEKYAGYSAEELDKELKERSNGRVQLDSAKMFQDGSIQGLTGALRQPYYQHPEIYGDLIHDEQLFQEEVLNLHERGFRITTHGNGDRAIGSILDAYANSLEKSPHNDHRHRIEHVQTATTDDLARMGKLGVAGSFFINHVYYWGDRHEQIFLGPERARRISPLAEAIEHNVLFTLHSDCPVTPISPLFSVWAAVNRITREGKVLGPEQRIDVETALKSMTIYGAKFIFEEENIGSIEVGKKADFAVLEADPTKVDPTEIKDISINATFIGGKPVYGHETLMTN
ncbi:amidohydrolase [Lentibacillus cibarius]|uniref:Amidohydrolase n=1 Tax=Lentibacillus cibarius TaxID=2583219 RepID=A0A5S3QIH6_9BACI|nr:amidohydrolase [Lentibacillus cibarius]TMN21724.1 amidohydrolase [Lentibacillus cibarius]